VKKVERGLKRVGGDDQSVHREVIGTTNHPQEGFLNQGLGKGENGRKNLRQKTRKVHKNKTKKRKKKVGKGNEPLIGQKSRGKT